MNKAEEYEYAQERAAWANLADAESAESEMRKALRAANEAMPTDKFLTDAVWAYLENVPTSERSEDGFRIFQKERFEAWFAGLSPTEAREILRLNIDALSAARGVIRKIDAVTEARAAKDKWTVRLEGRHRESWGFKLGLAFGAAGMWLLMITVGRFL
jgi:uncharacterized protein (DUF2236 family)